MSYVLKYTIKSFVPTNGSAQEVKADSVSIQGSQDQGEGTVDPSGKSGVSVTKGTIPTNLFFSVVDPQDNPYTVFGVAFSPDSPPATPFTIGMQTPAGSTTPQLCVTDNNNSGGSWEFYVLFRDSAKNIGLLDPMITNAESLPRAAG